MSIETPRPSRVLPTESNDFANEATLLCVSCGLCCDGTLHSSGNLKPGEVEKIRAEGMTIVDGDPMRFALPCPKLKDRRCSIFDRRPSVCGKYSCKLRNDLVDGLVPLDDAMERVREAFALIDKASRRAGGRASTSDIRAAALGAPDAEAAERLSAIVLELFLDRHFRISDEYQMFVSSVVDPKADSKE